MSCRKAYDLDLASFLGDPTGATWAEFRDHYPRCATCSAEVRAWTELHLALGEGSHPAPEDLLCWVDRPAALAPQMRHAIAEHLAACAPCRDEAHTLRTFDPLAAPAAERTRPAPAARPWRLPRLLRHPAFAYAIALMAVAYPLLSRRAAAPPPATSRPSRPAERPAEADEEGRLAKSEGALARAKPAAGAPPSPSTLALADRRAEPAGAGEARPVSPPPAPARQVPSVAQERDALEPLAASKEAAAYDRVAARADAHEIVLPAGQEATIPAPGATGEVRLRIGGGTPHASTVTLVDEESGRLLRAPARAGAGAAIDVPAAWLRPGRYRLEVAAEGTAPLYAILRVGP